MDTRVSRVVVGDTEYVTYYYYPTPEEREQAIAAAAKFFEALAEDCDA